MAFQERMTPQELRASVGLAGIFGLRMLGMFIILPVFALYAQHLPGGDAEGQGISDLTGSSGDGDIDGGFHRSSSRKRRTQAKKRAGILAAGPRRREPLSGPETPRTCGTAD